MLKEVFPTHVIFSSSVVDSIYIVEPVHAYFSLSWSRSAAKTENFCKTVFSKNESQPGTI